MQQRHNERTPHSNANAQTRMIRRRLGTDACGQKSRNYPEHKPCMPMLGSNFNTRESNCREVVQFFSTLLETVPFVFYHLWTQDSPICPLTFCGKPGPYIDQGGPKLRV